MASSQLKIGWAETDITPIELPVILAGQFHARVSEGVQNPLKSTALVIESADEYTVFISVDTVSISDSLRGAIREKLNIEGLDPKKVIFNATHTHTAPLNRLGRYSAIPLWKNDTHNPLIDSNGNAVELDVVPVENYIEYASSQIAAAITEAWQNRTPGGIAFGQDYAVIGRNRRWVDTDGISTMYGLNDNTKDRFHHIEGYEDHSLNLLATYDENDNLTGIVVNVPAPSQETEHLFEISADYWHETRHNLRQEHGEDLYILPQCSSAGDLTPHLIFDKPAHERMLQLRNRTGREEIAARITECVGKILPYIKSTIQREAVLKHEVEMLQLPANALSEQDLQDAQKGQRDWLQKFEEEKQKLQDNPKLLDEPRWYVPITRAFGRAGWFGRVIERYEKQKTDPNIPAETHVVRIGDIVFATNPFEYYLDYGIEIKVKSPAVQTFIVQLAGSGSYVPSPRAAAGGGYGAVPASNPVGAEGGQKLAEWTIATIEKNWE